MVSANLPLVQLIAAMNPCPCGYLGNVGINTCRCTPDQVLRYQGKLSGPLLDRIDMQVVVTAIAAHELIHNEPGESTVVVRQRCLAAHAMAMTRQGHTNQALQGLALDQHAHLDAPATDFLRQVATRLGWSSRSTHRALRVARTIADLADSISVQVPHIAEAVQYRRVLATQ